MTGCQCKSGFFTLRDCEEPPVKNCANCGRMMCARHTSPASGFTQCLDCWAKTKQEERTDEELDRENPTARDRDYDLDDEWTYGYRHTYYAGGYRPLYAGHDRFDDYDVRSFDDTAADDWDTGEGSGGFGDS